MNDVAVRVEGLGKEYRIGSKQEAYRTIRDSLTDMLATPFRRAGNLLRGQAYGAAGLEERIWALKDISFEVKRGEVLGIIGANGAGKSTLLKILSRITEPTEGYVDIYGRVGSLLEVGTGFHPELTGRENTYLNGAILGMGRTEIDRKFDEIVDFSGVEKFIDTPVKYYSSGMRLRLGFAVAAHLEPDILIVDEVLAVGDAEFQRKCLGKMQDVAGEGRTVLFVSHNMSAINNLCSRCIWLESGQIRNSGETNRVVYIYLSYGIEQNSSRKWEESTAPGDENVKLLEVAILGCESSGQISSVEDVTIQFTFEMLVSLPQGFRIGFDLTSGKGDHIFRAYQDDGGHNPLENALPGIYQLTATIPGNLLNQGIYYVSIRAGIHRIRRIIHIDRALGFEIINIEGVNSLYYGAKPGILALPLVWATNSLSNNRARS